MERDLGHCFLLLITKPVMFITCWPCSATAGNRSYESLGVLLWPDGLSTVPFSVSLGVFFNYVLLSILRRSCSICCGMMLLCLRFASIGDSMIFYYAAYLAIMSIFRFDFDGLFSSPLLRSLRSDRKPSGVPV